MLVTAEARERTREHWGRWLIIEYLMSDVTVMKELNLQ